jgi:hypothetical protein
MNSASDPGLTIFAYTAEPGSKSAEGAEPLGELGRDSRRGGCAYTAGEAHKTGGSSMLEDPRTASTATSRAALKGSWLEDPDGTSSAHRVAAG